MKIKASTLFICFFLIAQVSFAQDVDKAFLQGYDAALVIYNRTTGEAVNIDPSRSGQRLSPCSTFKIYNTLIGWDRYFLASASGYYIHQDQRG